MEVSSSRIDGPFFVVIFPDTFKSYQSQAGGLVVGVVLSIMFSVRKPDNLTDSPQTGAIRFESQLSIVCKTMGMSAKVFQP